MARIIDIEGIGQVYADRLKSAGIKTIAGLLRLGANANDRKALAERTGIRESQILKWIEHADMLQIEGIVEAENKKPGRSSLTRMRRHHNGRSGPGGPGGPRPGG